MKKIVKQAVGLDVAKDELVVCMGRMYDDLVTELVGSKTFANDAGGFASLVQWVEKLSDPGTSVRYVMEATGVYHESLAYYLVDQQREVSIVLPNKISNYARTLRVKTVTDKTASQAIARFGLERRLEVWSKPRGKYRTLRHLAREREQLIVERTMLKNQLHAEQAMFDPSEASIERMKARIVLLNQQEKQIKAELQGAIKADKETCRQVELMCTVPGIGVLTAASILGETNGFNLIRNKRQLTSYAGLDVVEKQSGTSVKAKPRISKKGNKHLRKTMHMPALAAIRHDQRFKAIFARLVSKHGIKMKAAVAIQRKLLEMTFTVYKTNRAYDKDYQLKQLQQEIPIKNQSGHEDRS